MKLTRRQLAAMVSTAAMTATDTQAQPQAAPPADELAAARERLKTSTNLLAQQQVPMAVEPAFQFKA